MRRELSTPVNAEDLSQVREALAHILSSSLFRSSKRYPAMLRYAELGGHVRRAITVLKMRGSDHDRRIREFHITDQGLKVGEPISGAGGLVVRGSFQSEDGRP